MSFITGTAVELLYASLTAGAAAAATSETQLNDTATMGVQARLEPDFWLPNNNQITRAIRIVARGILSTSGTAPNFTWTIRGGAAGTSGPVLLATAATAMAASQVNSPWLLDGDIIVSVMGANATVQGYGNWITGATASAWNAAMTGSAATLDTSITNYINVNLLASNAGNSTTLQQLLVYGLN